MHLTHIDNYDRFDRVLGLQGRLSDDPTLAASPDIAARIIVVGMRDGLFTGKKLSDYIDRDTDFFNARRFVNGVSERQPWSIPAAHSCVGHAERWLERVPAFIEQIRSEPALPPPFEGEESPALNRTRGAFRVALLSVEELQRTDHPLHAGYAAIQSGVAAWEGWSGKVRDGHTVNLELSLLRRATESGIMPEWVMPSIENAHVRAGQNVFVGQGDPGAHPRRYVHMETQTAIATPASESLRQIEAALAQGTQAQVSGFAPSMVASQDDVHLRAVPRV